VELAIFSNDSPLARALVDEAVAAGHAAHALGFGVDWIVEFEERPANVALIDVAADSSAARGLSSSMRESAAGRKIRQIAVVDVDDLGKEPVPPTVDELAVYPFRPGELASKLRLVEDAWRASSVALVFGNVVIDTAAYEVRLSGVPVALTFKEQELLHFLASNPDRVFSRSQLLTQVWGYDYFGGTRTVDVHVRRLRFKLGSEMESRIQTVRNVGYKFASNI